MSTGALARLRQDLEAKRLLVVVGAGVSMAATGSPLALWKGLILDGVDRLRANAT